MKENSRLRVWISRYFKTCPKSGRIIALKDPKSIHLLLFPIIGLAALVWFLVRTLPKASRAAYPCQRIALSIGLSFLAYVSGVITSITIFKNLKNWLGRFSKPVVNLSLGILVLFIGVATALTVESFLTGQPPVYADWEPGDAPNTPIGTGKGIFPGRVTWAHDANATSDSVSRYWWQAGNTDQSVVDSMIKDSLLALTNTSNIKDAWDALFTNFNQTHNRGNHSYTNGEKIAIKINTVNTYNQRKYNNTIDVCVETVIALLKTLVDSAGISQENIIIYDGGVGAIGDYFVNPVSQMFPDITMQSITPYSSVKAVEWVNEGISYSNGSVSSNAQTRRVAKAVWDADYLINSALLKKHENQTAITLCGKNHFGSIQNCRDVHTYINDYINGMGTYNCLVDLAGHEKIGGKTLLYLIDGLWAAPGISGQPTKWNTAPFNGDWPSSIFLSQDPVAIDSVGLDFINAEWTLWDNADNYLHEAALADNSPSGTVYDPEGDGIPMQSLGVHEHWNNINDKEYSRNLGLGEGIELIKVSESQVEPKNLGDVNKDGNIDIVDSLVIAQFYVGLIPEIFYIENSDVNEDGTTDIVDSLLIARFYVGLITEF